VNWTINGLPMHPLLVHAAVVLVPISALMALVGAVWPAAWRFFPNANHAAGAKPVLGATAAKVLPIVVAVLLAVGAIGSIAAVISIGDAGAKAVWSTTK